MFPMEALRTSGEANKQQVHKVLYMLQNLGLKRRECHDAQQGIYVCCINPFHLHLTSQRENIDRNRCVRSMGKWCPHSPKCVFISPIGQHLPCRSNADAVVYLYICGRGCYNELEDSSGRYT